jgi:F-type H+-transporting ATPase subunit delta
MADSRVASRYVKSLLSLAVEQAVLEEVHYDMQLFAKVCKENRAFRMMLMSPIIRHEKKREVLMKIFSGRLNPLSMSIIEILTRKNREPLLPAIAEEFHNAYNEHKGVGRASITTTIPMDNEMRATIEGIVRNLSNKKQVELDEKVDKDLIGGFILNVGDRQVDASVKNKLKSLKLKFEENYYKD